MGVSKSRGPNIEPKSYRALLVMTLILQKQPKGYLDLGENSFRRRDVLVWSSPAATVRASRRVTQEPIPKGSVY